MTNAIEIAIKMETDAIKFYKEAAEKCNHAVGKKMFLFIVEDEKRHLDMLSEIFKGLDLKIQEASPMFDETIEQMWIRQWLFYGNLIKYASAMSGAPDYATLKNGWWNLTENLQHMKDWIELKKKANGIETK